MPTTKALGGDPMKKSLAFAFLLLASQQLLAQNSWIQAPTTAQPPQPSARNSGEWEMHTSQHRFSGNTRVIATTSQGEESLGFACEYDKQKVVVCTGLFGKSKSFQAGYERLD